MKKKDAEPFKKSLLEKKQAILDQIQQIRTDSLSQSQRDAAGDLSAYTFHMADVASDSYDREFTLNLASSEQEVLYAIEEALHRIEDGTFGDCVECQKPISKARLKALPHARLCITCQGRQETEGPRPERE